MSANLEFAVSMARGFLTILGLDGDGIQNDHFGVADIDNRRADDSRPLCFLGRLRALEGGE